LLVSSHGFWPLKYYLICFTADTNNLLLELIFTVIVYKIKPTGEATDLKLTTEVETALK
jgi:hypothetical protein